jgi:hypothetical protein
MSRYTPRKFLRAIKEPARIRDEFRRLRKDFVQAALDINAQYYQTFSELPDSGVHVMDQDWDNLVILDACRFDLFDEIATFDYETQKVLSRAAESWEFMQENFVGRSLHDTVYVTANPHMYKIPDRTFHAVDNLLDDAWDEQLRTVCPDIMVDRTVKALETYPDKRIISHFMQPHFPFIGPTGRTLDYVGIELHLDDDQKTDFPHPWFDIMYGAGENERDITQAYRENYQAVLPHIKNLIKELPGKTVVTADHANLLGERTFPIPIRTFGHYPGIYKRELLEVPWMEVESNERRSISTDPPVNGDQMSEDVINDRLHNLGYRA